MTSAISKNYSNTFELLTDLNLYVTNRTGKPLNLSLLPAIAQSRYTWIVQNWNSLYQQFKTFAAGADLLSNSLNNFDNIVKSYNLGNTVNPFDTTSKIQDFLPFLEQITLTQLTLTPQELILINLEKTRVSRFSIDTFRNMLNFLNKKRAIADQDIGLGDPIARKYYGIANTKAKRSATIYDLAQLNELNNVISFIKGIIIDLKSSQAIPPNLLTIANQNVTTASGVRFNNAYLSYVSIPFENSLENMAGRYLGDKRRWFELVTVNNLQPPFVDEMGTKLYLTTSGTLNTLSVPDTLKDDMSVGTKVLIGSYSIREEPRIVEKIIDGPTNTLVVFLSGSRDLSKLKKSDKPFIRVYKSATVNSGSFIKIPLNVKGIVQSKNTPDSGVLRELDKNLLAFGVDILRDEKTNDFIVDSTGNFALAAGLTNVRQSILFAIKTVKGELPFHSYYGVPSVIGQRWTGATDAAVVFAKILRNTLLKDGRYQNIQIQNIATTNTGLSLNMLVTIQGLNNPIPLSYIS